MNDYSLEMLKYALEKSQEALEIDVTEENINTKYAHCLAKMSAINAILDAFIQEHDDD